MERPYGWVIVAAGALMGCVAIGAMFSLAVFLQPMSDATGWSRTGISTRHDARFPRPWASRPSAGARSPTASARASSCWRARCCSGSASCWRAAPPACSSSSSIYGVLVGVAAGAVFAPMMATVTGWFDKHRSLAVSLVSAGMGMAPMTISPFAQWLISSYDWRTAQLVIGIMAWVLLIPAALLVRRAPAADGAGAAACRRRAARA